VTCVNSGYLALELKDNTAVITHVFSFLCNCVNLNTEECKINFHCIYMNDLSGDISFVLKRIEQASATYGTRAKRGTWNDFQWHAEWIEIQ